MKLKIKNLVFQYPKSKKVIFNDFNWELDDQNVHFIIGENGSGKTTFYEIISGLWDYQGKIKNKINPQDILLQLQGVLMLKTLKGKELAELFMGADGGVKKITLENIRMNLPKERYEKLEYLWEATYGNMSAGERRWLLIYLFSLLDRELYIFDEPTSGLDILSAKEILQIIGNLVTERKKKVLLTTHRIEEIDYFDDYSVTFLHEGKNYFTGSKMEFKELATSSTEENIILKRFLNLKD